ncbi:sigma-70 family RNA polymerase sigma factor [bacterium]|nr:sigma-70 family RNA polymerase sigma factor [bacterium]
MNEDKINLIIKAKNGDKLALERLIKDEQSNIYATLFYLKKDSNDINDLAQDILIKLSKNISKLKNPSYFKTWLNQIILNSYYDYLRKQKKYSNEINLDNISSDISMEATDYNTNPQISLLNNELDFVIKTSIKNLPIHYKIPITLREIQGLSYDEISNITKTSVGTVKSRIARARAKIKDDIDKYSRS